MNSVVWIETTWNDVRHSLRIMRRNPTFTVSAILILAMGIGGNTAISSMVRAVLLKPLAYSESDRLVCLTADHARKNQFDTHFQLARLEEMQKAHSSVGSGDFGDNLDSVRLSGRGQPEAIDPMEALRIG